MATSGNILWELNRNQIIEAAYRKIGLPGEGNTLTSEQYDDGLDALNAVVALAVTDGMALWKRTTTTIIPTATIQAFTITGAVKVAQVVLRDTTSGTQYELEVKSLYDFNRLPYNTEGIPVNYTFAPTINGGTLSIWPNKADTGTVASKELIVTYQAEFEGFTTTTSHTPDFPPYWTQALIYKTAVALAPEFGIPLEDRKALQQEAAVYWAQASSYGDEEGSIFIQPYAMKW